MLRLFFVTSDRRLALFWRVSTYLLITIIGFIALLVVASLIGSWHLSSITTQLSDIPLVLVSIPLIMGITSWYRRRIDRRPWRGMALTALKGHWNQLGLGILVGGTVAIATNALALLTGNAQWDTTSLKNASASGLLVFVVFQLCNTFAVGLREEVLFRGYIFQNIGEQFSLWGATLVTALLFALFHGINGLATLTFGFLLFSVILSIIFVMLRLLTGSLWMAIGWHAANDFISTTAGRTSLHIATNGFSIVDYAPYVLALLLLLGTHWSKLRRFDWLGHVAITGEFPLVHATANVPKATADEAPEVRTPSQSVHDV